MLGILYFLISLDKKIRNTTIEMSKSDTKFQDGNVENNCWENRAMLNPFSIKNEITK